MCFSAPAPSAPLRVVKTSRAAFISSPELYTAGRSLWRYPRQRPVVRPRLCRLDTHDGMPCWWIRTCWTPSVVWATLRIQSTVIGRERASAYSNWVIGLQLAARAYAVRIARALQNLSNEYGMSIFLTVSKCFPWDRGRKASTYAP